MSKYLRRFMSAPALVLVGGWVIFFAPLWSGTHVYFLDDLKIIYYPLEVVYATWQQAGELPGWNPLFGFGHPVLSWAQLGFFIPVHLVLRALHVPPLELLQVSVMAYWALGLLGAYLYSRRVGLGRWPAVLAASVFCFSGFAIGHLNHVNFYTGMMLLPWLLVAADQMARRPGWRMAVVAGALAGIIGLSSQPQVSLYVVAIATLYGLMVVAGRLRQRHKRAAYVGRVAAFVVLAGGLAAVLSSVVSLPLLDFLPLTERNDALPEQVLYEFSYPPTHAVTLVWPYFFGGHDNYWGAKGFQELAAFVGLIPLALAGISLFSRRFRLLTAWSWILIVLGACIALGKYSPLYRWLVEEKFLETLAVPGRFVMLMDVGLAFAAAIGLESLLRRGALKGWQGLVGGSVLPLLVVAATISGVAQEQTIRDQLLLYITQPTTGGILLVLSIMALVAAAFFERARGAILAGTSVLVLVALALPYNPLLPRSELSPSGLGDSLAAFSQTHGHPARLYSRDELIVPQQSIEQKVTPPIGPDFSVLQPVEVTHHAPCYQIPFSRQVGGSGTVAVSLHKDVLGEALETHLVSTTDIIREPDQKLCFATDSLTSPEAILSFSSSAPSFISVSYVSVDNPSLYLIRVVNPTAEQVHASQKNLELAFGRATRPGIFEEDLLARHLNVAAGASAARWIGALSIRPYREFIEFFLANDQEPFDGDGQHVLEANRRVVDLAGITHLAETVLPENKDRTSEEFELIFEEPSEAGRTLRVFANPSAVQKVFTVPQAQFIAADDEARVFIMQQEDLFAVMPVVGDEPPPDEALKASVGEAELQYYTATEVATRVRSSEGTWLVLTDSTTPAWQTYIDGSPAPTYRAYTIYRAAYVPAGEHTVTFVYEDKVLEHSKRISSAGLLTILVLLVAAVIVPRKSVHS